MLTIAGHELRPHVRSARYQSHRQAVAGFGFDPRSGHVGFVVDKAALMKVFSE
jgi:hypothetical protein